MTLIRLNDHRTNLRPQLRALMALRDAHRQMRLCELEKVALLELFKMHAMLDELTWEDGVVQWS